MNIETKLINTKEKLFALKKDFTYTIDGKKYTFNYKNGKKEESIIFTDYEKTEFLHIIKKVKADMIRAYFCQIAIPDNNRLFWEICDRDFYTLQKKPKKIVKKNIHYISFSKIGNLNGKDLLEIDINAAYIVAAHNLGYLSEANFNLINNLRNNINELISQGIDVAKNKERLSQLKYAALTGIGACGKLIMFEKYFMENGQYKKHYYDERLDSHVIMKHIHYYVGQIMWEISLKVPHYFFWVDAFFVDAKYKEKVLSLLNGKGFAAKSERAKISFCGDRIVVRKLNNKNFFKGVDNSFFQNTPYHKGEIKKKEYFLDTITRNRINNYF